MRRAAGLTSAQVIALMVITAERRAAAAGLRRDLRHRAGEVEGLLAALVERGWPTCDGQGVHH